MLLWAQCVSWPRERNTLLEASSVPVLRAVELRSLDFLKWMPRILKEKNCAYMKLMLCDWSISDLWGREMPQNVTWTCHYNCRNPGYFQVRNIPFTCSLKSSTRSDVLRTSPLCSFSLIKCIQKYCYKTTWCKIISAYYMIIHVRIKQQGTEELWEFCSKNSEQQQNTTNVQQNERGEKLDNSLSNYFSSR